MTYTVATHTSYASETSFFVVLLFAVSIEYEILVLLNYKCLVYVASSSNQKLETSHPHLIGPPKLFVVQKLPVSKYPAEDILRRR